MKEYSSFIDIFWEKIKKELSDYRERSNACPTWPKMCAEVDPQVESMAVYLRELANNTLEFQASLRIATAAIMAGLHKCQIKKAFEVSQAYAEDFESFAMRLCRFKGNFAYSEKEMIFR